MRNSVYIAVSIDGFIATEDGGIDWLMNVPNPDKSDFGFNEFMKNIDAVVMGKNTFEKVLTFGKWPYEKPVFVLSNSLKKLQDELKSKVEILNGTPVEITKKLNSEGFNNLYIDGGKVVQEFLKYKLVDELIISQIPVLLGSGIPLFGKTDNLQNFELLETKTYNKTIVKTHYRKI